MLDLANLPTEALMRLTRTNPRRDSGLIAWDIDLAIDVSSDTDAELIDRFVPGSLRAFRAGLDGSKGSASTSGGFPLLFLALSSEDGAPLASGYAEVRKATLSAAQQKGVLVIRLRAQGLLDRAAINMVYSLDALVNVRIARESPEKGRMSVSQAIGAATQPARSGPDYTGKIVTVKSDDRTICGVCLSHEGQILTIDAMEDEAPVTVTYDKGTEHEIGAIEVAPPDGRSMSDLINDYMISAETQGVEPSWTDVLKAIGELYAAGDIEPRPDFAWPLEPVVWTHALQLAMARE